MKIQVSVPLKDQGETLFAGHVGAALAIGRIERRVNVGLFVTAALLLDFVLWLFILFGWESVNITEDFSTTHQPHFVFPSSHGLLAAGGWSAAAGVLTLLLSPYLKEARRRAAALVAGAVFSHWLLDVLVHRSELPLTGNTSVTVGLALWNDMPAALAIEAAIVALGLCLFLPKSGLARGKSIALGILILIVLMSTIIGMTIAPPPSSAAAMAGSSLVALVAVCGLIAWLGRVSREERFSTSLSEDRHD
ncbi:MAG: hypothetical protein H8K07_00365 [Nitrospira sp.]|nr:hypothetical protein [Nitrospira sp.]